MSSSPTRSRWRRLGWLLVAPVLMAESFVGCPSACGSAASKVGLGPSIQAWTVRRELEGAFSLSAAKPKAVYDVKLVVGIPPGAKYDAVVGFELQVKNPMVLRRCETPGCTDGRPCDTYSPKSGIPGRLAVYPLVDPSGRSRYLDVVLTPPPGRELRLEPRIGADYPCAYRDGGLSPHRGLGFAGTFRPGDPKVMPRDPVSGQFIARFRVTFAATDPEGSGYDLVLQEREALTSPPVTVAYEKGRAYPSSFQMRAKIEGPWVKETTPADKRPPRPELEVTVTPVE